MRIIKDYDVIKNRNNDTDSILLLHPDLIEEELSKIERCCPIYVYENNGIISNVLIPNKPIESLIYTEELKYYIPTGVYMPIGGSDGKYFVETYGTYIDRKSNITREAGYRIVDKKTSKVVYEGERLSYLGRSLAILDNFYITKNTIFDHKDMSVIFPETGYIILSIKKDKDYYKNIFALYDAEGNFVSTDYSELTYDDMTKIAMNAPKLQDITLPKNISLFEQMIITSLKDKKEFIDCDANTLIDIVNYIKSKNLEIAIDLDSLAVYKVDYQRYFNFLAHCKENGPTGAKLVLKNRKKE